MHPKTVFSTLLKLATLTCMAAILLVAACKKDDPSGVGPDKATTTFTAKINGKQFGTFDVANVYYREKSLLVEIFAKEKSEYFYLYIIGFTGVGVYPLERENSLIQGNLLAYGIFNTEMEVYNNTLHSGGPGNVQVTYFDPEGTISLHFSCRLSSFDSTGEVEVSGASLSNAIVSKEWPLTSPPSYLIATVDNKEFVAYPEPQWPNGRIQINAFDGGLRAIQLEMPYNIAPGTYDLTALPFEGTLYAQGSSYAKVKSGAIVITENSFDTDPRWIRGTFHFTSDSNHVVTNGEFYVEN